jgi:hypothetical protein
VLPLVRGVLGCVSVATCSWRFGVCVCCHLFVAFWGVCVATWFGGKVCCLVGLAAAFCFDFDGVGGCGVPSLFYCLL